MTSALESMIDEKQLSDNPVGREKINEAKRYQVWMEMMMEMFFSWI